MKKESVIELRDITKIYRTGGEDTAALGGVSMSIEQGEFVAIMGPSGSGKSTLMHILGLLDVPDTGSYLLDGIETSSISRSHQAEIRNKQIGFVFQQFNLLPRSSVLDNVLLPTIYASVQDPVRRARQLIGEMGLEDKTESKSNELSGGQTQRVAIARALVMDPAIVLADEPTGNLDTKTSHEIMSLIQKINHDGATIVLITHDEDIAGFARRIVRLRDGLIVNE